MVGGIASLSIVEIRNEVVHGSDGLKSVNEINFIDNFKKAFTDSYTEVGMDLGNAAEGIDHCYKKMNIISAYFYGMDLYTTMYLVEL